MCGIVGVTFKTAPADRGILARMRETMRHRGPDDAGEWWSPNGRVALGQRRLTIIDLSPGGHQPMQDAGGTITIVFNGEIYNYGELRGELVKRGHVFRTASDTEVILAAYTEWAEECLQRLNGMFAFCIYDEKRGQLFIARDRAGEKPLYYYTRGEQFAFASELKAFLLGLRIDPRLDLDALEHYLGLGYVPGEKCILSNVRKLPAAHALIYNLNTQSVRTWRYWKLPSPCTINSIPAEDLVLELEKRLSDAVGRQLIADVPVGVLLSGGVDSSVVTALAARQSRQPIRTFNVSFPGAGVFDEAPFARAVARHFGTEHIELQAQAASVDVLPRLAEQYDEPLGDSSLVPTHLICELVRKHCTVALGGDGGDELFGGYNNYSAVLKRIAQLQWVPERLISMLSAAAAAILPMGFRGRGFLIALADNPVLGIARGTSYFDACAREKLLRPEFRLHTNGKPEEFRKSIQPFEGASVLQAATIGDFSTYLPDDILCKVDRASMLNSLEVRAPFLDTNVIEFAFGSIPDRLRATAKQRKILLRMLAKRLLPPEINLERKQGFSIPLHQWFSGAWGEMITDVLCARDQPLFEREAVRRLLKNQRRGYANTSRLFALVMFELWRRRYKISI